MENPFARALVVSAFLLFSTSLTNQAGAVAGTSVDLSLYPIDTVKTRLQSATGFWAAGGFRGIYAGVGSVALGAAPGAALFFVTYEFTKSFLRQKREQSLSRGDPVHAWLEPLEHMGAACAGEVAACAVRVPTEVVKSRAQAGQHGSSLTALQAILARRGATGALGVWRELYRGWTITVMREVPFTVIQFPLWEAMKEWRRRESGTDTPVSAAESGVFGAIAGGVAAGVTTPLDVLKTRMMLAAEKQRVFPLLIELLRESGPRAFFKGTTPRVMWISLGGFVFLGSYQWALNML